MNGFSFIDFRAMITPIKETALIVKHHAGPNSAYVIPAIAGPTAVAVLNIVEFKAIAFVRSSLFTSSSIKDCLAGASNELAIPRKNASTIICQCKHGENNREQHHKTLRDHQYNSFRKPVSHYAGVHHKKPGGSAHRETDIAKVERGMGQFKN
jgi:hypothetical protein